MTKTAENPTIHKMKMYSKYEDVKDILDALQKDCCTKRKKMTHGKPHHVQEGKLSTYVSHVHNL